MRDSPLNVEGRIRTLSNLLLPERLDTECDTHDNSKGAASQGGVVQHISIAIHGVGTQLHEKLRQTLDETLQTCQYNTA